MAFTSNLPRVKSQIQQARESALQAVGAVVKAEVQRRLEGGFTSGDFDTGESVEHVQTEIRETATGAEVRIGTDLVHNLVWEVGHVNVYTRKFERVETWMPALLSTRAEQQAVFAREYKQALK